MKKRFLEKNVEKTIQTKSHLYIFPHPYLASYIAHYTITYGKDSKKLPETLTLIPDASGCIVFSFNKKDVDYKIWGATTKTVIVENHTDNLFRVFIEFLPGGLAAFLELSQAEAVDCRIPLEEMGKEFSYSLIEAIKSAEDIKQLVDLFDAFFLKCLKQKTSYPLFLSIAELLKKTKGITTIQALSQKYAYSERHLNRIFKEHSGISMKHFARIVRMNSVLQTLEKKPLSLTMSAYDNGFYDQAHFIHDFKSVCGVTPKKYLSNLSNYYHEPLKFI